MQEVRVVCIYELMTAPIPTKTFISGNSVAVRLHRALGLAADLEVTIEPLGDGVWIRPKGPRQSLSEMSARLLALGPIESIELRDDDMPERPGL